MNRTLSRCLLCAVALTFLGDNCSGVSVENGSFRVWEGDGRLGAWDVTEGSIRKAPTWDDSDPGVEFVDTPTEIAQTVTATSTCAQVTVMGLVDESARLAVSTTTSVAIPALNWDSYTFYLNFSGIPSDSGSADGSWGSEKRSGNTIRIRKSGTGTVILARIEVKGSSGCGPSTANP
jgi:hypothetical protein